MPSGPWLRSLMKNLQMTLMVAPYLVRVSSSGMRGAISQPDLALTVARAKARPCRSYVATSFRWYLAPVDSPNSFATSSYDHPAVGGTCLGVPLVYPVYSSVSIHSDGISLHLNRVEL